MFYVKEQLNDAMEVSIEINDENVFCRCPHCGSEVQVDLAEVFADGVCMLPVFGRCCREHCKCTKVQPLRCGAGIYPHCSAFAVSAVS